MQLGMLSADLLNNVDAGEGCRTAVSDGLLDVAGSLLPLDLTGAGSPRWVNPCASLAARSSSSGSSNSRNGGGDDDDDDSSSDRDRNSGTSANRSACSYFTCGYRDKLGDLPDVEAHLEARVHAGGACAPACTDTHTRIKRWRQLLLMMVMSLRMTVVVVMMMMMR